MRGLFIAVVFPAWAHGVTLRISGAGSAVGDGHRRASWTACVVDTLRFEARFRLGTVFRARGVQRSVGALKIFAGDRTHSFIRY